MAWHRNLAKAMANQKITTQDKNIKEKSKYKTYIHIETNECKIKVIKDKGDCGMVGWMWMGVNLHRKASSVYSLFPSLRCGATIQAAQARGSKDSPIQEEGLEGGILGGSDK